MKKLKTFVFITMKIFCIFFILTFPLGFEYVLEPSHYLSFFSEKIVAFLSKNIFKVSIQHKLLSDSKALYIHSFFLLLFSSFLAISWQVISHVYRKNTFDVDKLKYYFFVILRYYLALVLLQYGFAKVFQTQFYKPEPNTLFTPLGFLEKDILYWSSTGSSSLYNFFGGWVEVLVAVFLLFRKTYLFGSSLAFLALIHIVAINFGFNISVKVLSSFLLLVSFILLSPQLPSLFKLFFLRKSVSLKTISIHYPNLKAKIVATSLKSVIILYFFTATLIPYVFPTSTTNEFISNLIGAYKVMKSKNTEATIFRNAKRIFVHSQSYLIVEDWEGNFKDYEVVFLEKSIYIKRQNQLVYFESHNNFTKIFYSENNILLWEFELEKINLNTLPLRQDTFDWSVD